VINDDHDTRYGKLISWEICRWVRCEISYGVLWTQLLTNERFVAIVAI